MKRNLRVKSDPSQQVLELQQTVAKLEKEKHDALLIAHTAQARVEFLENLRDRERVAREKKLTGTKKTVDELRIVINHLNLQLKAEQSRAIEDRKRQCNTIVLLRQRNDARIEEMTRREKEQARRIAESTRKLARCEGVLQRRPASVKQKQKPGRVHAQRPSPPQPLHITYNLINIFAPCAESVQSISYDSAAEQLRSIYEANCEDRDWYARYCEIVKYDCLICDVCCKTVLNQGILNHFFASGHISKLRADYSGSVPLPAFEYWMRKLRSITKPTQAASATHLAASSRDAPAYRNVFKLVTPGSSDSIPFLEAVSQLRTKFADQDSEWLQRYQQAVQGEMGLYCATCYSHKTFNGCGILDHFLSPIHSSKMHQKACISLVAFDYWLCKLESISKKPFDITATPLDGMPKKLQSIERPAIFAEEVDEQELPSQGDESAHSTSLRTPFQEEKHSNGTNNIFAVHPDSPATITINSAAKQLRAIYNVNYTDKDWYAGYQEAVKNESLYCEVCCLQVDHRWILNHLFAEGHLRKACARLRATSGQSGQVRGYASVPLVAFEYWKQKLESITKKPNTVAPMEEMPMESIEQPILFAEIKEEDIVMKEIKNEEVEEY